MFLWFLSFKPAYSKAVNFAASLTFGVYLFHDNQLIRSMWQGVFKTSQFIDSPWLPVHALGAVISVYLAGSLIELLRQKTVGPLWQSLTDRFFVPAWNFIGHWLISRLGLPDRQCK